MATRTLNKSKRKEQSEYYFDYSLLFIVLFLLGFGLVMIYSTSSYEAFQEYNDSAHYLKVQLLACILGLFVMMVVANIPYHFWEHFAVLGYFLSMGSLFLVKTPLGVSSHGAARWFRIPGVPLSIQPAEICKLCMILFLACLICKLGKNVRTWKGIIVMGVAALPHVVLIKVITNNLSSAIIVLGIAALMVFVADPHYRKYIIGGSAAAIAIAGLVYAIVTADSTDGMNFRFRRINIWLHPELDPSDTGFQTLQALYAIGSGGIWGKGLGQSMQKLGFLPEAQNDMIFSIICEELGLFGAVSIILLFLMLLWRLMLIAMRAPDLLGSMLVVGVIGHIAIQVILNIAVVTNSIPNTGISLPFISYGGSSVMFLLIEIGLVMSVARRIQYREM